MNMKNKIIIALLVFFLPLIIWSAFLSFGDGSKSAEVQVIIAPQSVSVTNGKDSQVVSNEDVIKLKPGSYELLFSKTNFKDIKKKIEVKKDSFTRLTVILDPKNASGENELLSQPNQIAMQGVADIEHVESEKFFDKNPITSKLRFKNPIYTIDYSRDPVNDSLIINISTYDGYRQVAIDKIKSWGYNPADFNIKFNNYVNPFAL